MKKVNSFGTLAVLTLLTVMLTTCSKGVSDVVTVTLLLLGNKPTNGKADAAIAEINKITAERIGAVLQTRYIEWADWQSQYQLALASGDPSLDMVTVGNWLEVWKMARAGAFLPLTEEMLEKNAPMTWAAIPRANWDTCSGNGSIWFIPEDQFSQYVNHGMYWRKDWALEGGLEDVAVFEDLEKYWDIVKKNHPEAFPWDVSASTDNLALFQAYLQGKYPVHPIVSIEHFYYNDNDPYTALCYWMDGNELIEAAKLFDRWGKKRFWREDVLNYRGDTRNLLLAGLSGSDQHHTNTYITLREQMDREHPGSELQMYYFGKEINNVNRNIIITGGMAINAASKKAEKALQMYDLLRNDKQIYLLYNYGIEGKDYTINPDGTFKLPDGFNVIADTLDTNFWCGRMDEFEPVWESWWDGRVAFIEHLNSFAKNYPLTKFAFDESNVRIELASLLEVTTSLWPAIHFGKTSDPVKAVADFRAAMRRAGYDKVKAELQSQLNAFKAQN